MEVTIEGGCDALDEDLWRYQWSDNDGFHSVIFDSFGARPKIGDKIVDYVLVPLEGYKINSDTSKWRQHYENEWPKDTY